MLKFIVFLALLISFTATKSQSIVVKSFRWQDAGQINKIPEPDKDLSKKKFAVIKVETPQNGFKFDFGSPSNLLSTVRKAGVYWLWVSAGIQKVTINNQELGLVCKYPFGKELENAQVYVMELNTANATSVIENPVAVKWLTLESTPLGANISIDGYPAGQTPFYGSLTLGSHKVGMVFNGRVKEDVITVLKDKTPSLDVTFPIESNLNIDSLNLETEAEFPGGLKPMQLFLQSNLQYPLQAQVARIMGTIYVQFKISETGKISEPKVLRGIGGGCDEEAIRVVNKMPNWAPKRIGGKAVPCQLTFPVKFISLGIVNQRPSNQ